MFRGDSPRSAANYATRYLLCVGGTMVNCLGGGWIYVLMTSSDYNRFKVGRTVGNPLLRLRNLRTGDPKLDLQAAYFLPRKYGQLSRIEWSLQKEFGTPINFHDEGESEWFTGSAKAACGWIDEVLYGWADSPLYGLSMFDTQRICKTYEEDLRVFYGMPE